MMKDMSASIRAKLLNLSRQQNRAFDEIMIMYMLERLLYRLSYSRYKNNFVLKGGLLLCVLFENPHRTTKDVDFLGRQLASQLEDIKAIFKEICMLEIEDGVIYAANTIETIRIKEDADYEGVRVLIECRLGQAKKLLQIDIGFGDVIVPRPQNMQYPTILDMDSPEMLVYSLESVVAEKFEAMIKLAKINSRMKDFYDVYMMTESFDFDGRILYEAIFETFQRRGTPYERDPDVFLIGFYNEDDKKKQWDAFVKRAAKVSIPFEQVIDRIKVFLYPVYSAMLEETEFFGKWSKKDKKWRKEEKSNDIC